MGGEFTCSDFISKGSTHTTPNPLPPQPKKTQSTDAPIRDFLLDNICHTRFKRHAAAAKILWNCPVCQVKAMPHSKHYFAVAQPQAMRVERLGLILLPLTCGAVAANHNAANSQRCCQKWQHIDTYQMLVNHAKYISTHITAETIATAVRKGRKICVRLWVKVHLHH